MDGVLVDFVGGILELTGKPDPYNDPNNHGIWDVTALLKLDNIWESLEPGFWSDLKPMADFDKIMDMARKYEYIHILSAPPSTGQTQCYEGKVKWLQKHLPDLVNSLMFGKQKFGFAGPDKILIDDSDENINLFIANGGNGLLIPRKWNSKYERFRVHEGYAAT